MLMTFFFFFNDTATTEIYTLSLHDALPIFHLRWGVRQSRQGHRAPDRPQGRRLRRLDPVQGQQGHRLAVRARPARDRKSTRLNSSHANISYAVFCLKKKKTYSIVVC